MNTSSSFSALSHRRPLYVNLPTLAKGFLAFSSFGRGRAEERIISRGTIPSKQVLLSLLVLHEEFGEGRILKSLVVLIEIVHVESEGLGRRFGRGSLGVGFLGLDGGGGILLLDVVPLEDGGTSNQGRLKAEDKPDEPDETWSG